MNDNDVATDAWWKGKEKFFNFRWKGVEFRELIEHTKIDSWLKFQTTRFRFNGTIKRWAQKKTKKHVFTSVVYRDLYSLGLSRKSQIAARKR